MESKKSNKGVIIICVTIVLSLIISALLLGFILIYFNPENVEDRRNEKIAKEYFKTLNEAHDSGQTTWQSGYDSVSTQEFASYDNTKVSGTQVTTALSMFQAETLR